MKKLASITFSLLCGFATATTAFAGGKDFSVGLQTGYAFGSGKATEKGFETEVDGTNVFFKDSLSTDGAFAGIYAAYRTDVTKGCNPLMLGGELSFDFSGAQGRRDTVIGQRFNNAEHRMKLSQRWSAQPVVTVGTDFKGLELDLRLGASFSRSKISFLNQKNVKNKVGTVIGVRAGGMVSDDLELSLVYDWAFYGKIKKNIPTYDSFQDNTVKIDAKHRVASAKLRLGYHF